MSTRSLCPRACLAAALIAGAAGARAGERLVDPTRPPSAAAAVTSDALHVEAVILREGSRIAIVDGRIVRAGDRLGDTRIEEVTAEGVRYFRHGRSGFARLTVATVAVRHALLLGNDLP
ncbi:MAG: hypothetical protein ACREUT_20950 [Steroidobacteraceae bacterium]